jgi:amino acid adenylation domain-containing protein
MNTDYRALLHDSLWAAAARTPSKTALIAGDEHCSYATLAARATTLAATLQDLGLARGDRVGIFMENSIACAAAIFAVLKAGGVFVLVNPQTRADKLAFIVNDCDIGQLVTDAHLRGVVDAAQQTAPSLAHVHCDGDGDGDGERASKDPSGLISPGAIPVDLAALIYTSGSTGHPKGVMQTHQSMVFARGSIIEYLGLQPDDVMLNVLPLAFDYGLYQLLMSVHLGATLVLARSFTFPAEVFRLVTAHRVTVFPGVPTLYAMMLSLHARQALCFPSVRLVTNTAAALPSEFIARLQCVFPNASIFAMYGLTECKRVSYLPPELLAAKPGSVGKAIPGTEVYLRSEAGASVEAGEHGILHVRGPHLMRGYWNRPEDTAWMLREGDHPGEQVLYTGDWFRMDEEGYLYFVGRSDDIIKSRGEKVSPAEVENALYAVPGVREAAVVGVPDAMLGEAVRAFVVFEPLAGLDERKLRAALQARLEPFMVPSTFVMMAELPKGENGKIARRALAALALQTDSGDSA